MSASSPVRDLRAGLARLRARIRGLFVLTGVARLVASLLLALGLYYAADLFLDLPLGVRTFTLLGLLGSAGTLPGLVWLPLTVLVGLPALLLARGGRPGASVAVFAFAGLAGLAAWWLLRALAPLGARLSDAELVAAVEARNPRLQDRLASALDFDAELARPARGESAEMMRVVVAEAGARARETAFGSVASTRTTAAWLGTAALVLVGATATVALSPAKAGLFARRSLLLEDVAWPRENTLLAVALAPDGSVSPWPAERPFEVAVGRSLVVYALAEGSAPDDAQLLDLAEGEQPLPRRMFPVAGREGLWSVELMNVRQSFRFVLRGGDDQDDVPVYRVATTVPPAVLDVKADLVFPPYLGRAAQRAESGNLTVPQGTEITITFEPSEPLAQARVLLGDALKDAERVTADGGGELWRFAFTAERTLRYRLALRTPAGRENEGGADAFEITVAPDKAPRVDWLWPRGAVELTPNGRVPLLARTQDDHGVAALALELRAGPDAPVERLTLEPRNPAATSTEPQVREGGARALAANDGALGRPQVLTYVPLDLAWLAPTGGYVPPAAVDARIVATDSKGQVHESAWQSVAILGVPEVERGLATRRSAVKSAVRALLDDQEARLAQVTDLLQGPIGDSERDLLKSIQFAQGRIEQHADRAVRDFTDIFTLFVLDRLGAENPNERILALLDRHLRTTYGQPREGASATDDPVLPWALYDEIVAAWRAKTILDSGLLERMCAVLADAVESGARLAPQAHRAAIAAAGGDPDALAALRHAQRSVAASLTALLESMASWESLNDLILHLKRLVELQRALLDQFDAAPARAPNPGR